MILTAEQFGGVNIKVFKRFLTRERERFLKIAGINRRKSAIVMAYRKLLLCLCCVM